MELSKGSSWQEQNQIAKMKKIIAEKVRKFEEDLVVDIVANMDWSDDGSIQKTIHGKGKTPQFPSK